MRKNHINIPVGVLDTDSDLTQVSPEDFTYSLNTRQHPGEKIRRNIKGNVLVPYTNPAGTNETVGFVEDKYKKTGVEFVSNNLGNDQIRRFSQDDDAYDLLLEWSGLNFTGNIEAGVIDGRHLFWVEANGDFELTGNQPRYIDMEYISLRDKLLCYEIYWDSASFVAGTEYSIRIEDLDGNIVLPTEVFYTAIGGDVEADAFELYAALATGTYSLILDVTSCDNKTIVCHKTAERRIYITSSGNDIHFVPSNHYPETIIEDYISLIRQMPEQPPAPRYENDTSILQNRLFGFTFQFRYRYLYWNGSKSKWSPISYVPTNFVYNDDKSIYENSDLYNKVVISFDDERFGSADWKAFVRKVEVAVRYEFTGVWKSVEVIDIAGIGISTHEYEFLNNKTYAPVPSDENSEADVQALGNFDFVPRLSRALEIIQDERGRHRVALGGNIEQYDQPDCITANVNTFSSIDLPFPTEDIFPTENPVPQTTTRKRFKAGGVYMVYVIFEDNYGRQWPAIKVGEYINVAPEDAVLEDPGWWVPGKFYPNIAINLDSAPEGATRFRIAFSENQNQAVYFQTITQNAIYCKKTPHPDGGDDSFTATTYGAGDADLVAFEIELSNLDLESQVNILFSDETTGFLPQTGDRLHIILPGVTVVSGASPGDDYLIEGYNLALSPSGNAPTEDSMFVFIKYVDGDPDYTLSNVGYTNYHIIELYRPREADSDIVYEIGEAHDVVGGVVSISITDMGDAYINVGYMEYDRLNSLYPNLSVTVSERPTLYGFKRETGQDFGRPNAEDTDYREVDSYDQVRVSDVYLPDTQVNGFHSFRGTEYIRTRRDYGSIQSLQFCNGVLLAVGQFASQPIYVGKEQLLDLSGSTSVGRSSQLLNIAGELDKMLGTHDPASIVNTGKYVYGWDGYRGVPWRYSVGGGQDEINIKNVELFRSLGKLYFPQRMSVKVLGGYQEEFDTYFLTFRQSIREGRTLGFCESIGGDVDKKGWIGDFSFIPSYYGSIGLDFFSFYDGRAYRHEDIVPCRFYGTQYDAEIKLVVNSDPQAVKLFWNIREQGSKWWVPLATIPIGVYPTIQSTRILAAKFEKKEGQYKVDIPRDGNDPGFGSYIERLLRGRRMRGETLEITFRLELPLLDGFLKRVDVEYSASNETK